VKEPVGPHTMSTILLVEDDPLQAFVRISALEKKFQDVRRVADPAEALGMIEQPHFADTIALIISDLHMPGIKGPEFVAELHTRLPSVPVLVLLDRGESSQEYASDRIRFVTRPGSDEMLAVAAQLVADGPSR
jgi:CheY-like chemotaxis protein